MGSSDESIISLAVLGDLPWQGYMLIASHGAMAVQGILYARFYRMKIVACITCRRIWTIHDVVITIPVLIQYPEYPGLEIYIKEIGYFTFWLSIVSIGLCLILCSSL